MARLDKLACRGREPAGHGSAGIWAGAQRMERYRWPLAGRPWQSAPSSITVARFRERRADDAARLVLRAHPRRWRRRSATPPESTRPPAARVPVGRLRWLLCQQAWSSPAASARIRRARADPVRDPATAGGVTPCGCIRICCCPAGGVPSPVATSTPPTGVHAQVEDWMPHLERTVSRSRRCPSHRFSIRSASLGRLRLLLTPASPGCALVARALDGDPRPRGAQDTALPALPGTPPASCPRPPRC